MSWVQETCSNLYYPFHSDSEGLSKVQDDQEEFCNPIISSKDSLAGELTFGNTNSSTTIVDTFGPPVFRVLEGIFWVAGNLSLLFAFFLEFEKVTSNCLVSTTASSVFHLF